MDLRGERFTYGVVFEKVQNTDHRVLYPKFTDVQIRYYLYQILKALDFAHEKGE